MEVAGLGARGSQIRRDLVEEHSMLHGAMWPVEAGYRTDSLLPHRTARSHCALLLSVSTHQASPSYPAT